MACCKYWVVVKQQDLVLTMSELSVSIFYQFGVETMRQFAYTFPHVPVKWSVDALCWGVVLADKMANLPVDGMEDFPMSRNDEPDRRAFLARAGVKTGMLSERNLNL